MVLLDTNVVSELRRRKPHGAVVSWFESMAEEDLYLSAVSLAEIQAGIEITREQDPTKAAELEIWLDRLAEAWNVLPMDARVFRLWARLMHRTSDTLYEDAMIAATARAHGLAVATRNVRDFADFGVRVINPFETVA